MKKSVVSQSIASTSHTGSHATSAEHGAASHHHSFRYIAAPTKDDLRESYARIEPECGGLTADQLALINVDVQYAVSTVHQALPAVMAQRDQLAALPRFDLHKVDKLQDYTLALWYIDQLSQTGNEPTVSLPELANETVKVRDELVIAARPLTFDGTIASADLDTMAKSTAYAAIANDVVRLTIIYDAAWEKIVGRTVVTRERLATAQSLAARLAAAAEQRDFAAASLPEAARNRQRVYTLFRGAYMETRRGLAFLRAADGDVDTILPTIFARSPHYSTPASKSGDGAKTNAPAESATAPAAPAAPASTVAPATTTHTSLTVPQDDPFGRS